MFLLSLYWFLPLVMHIFNARRSGNIQTEYNHERELFSVFIVYFLKVSMGGSLHAESIHQLSQIIFITALYIFISLSEFLQCISTSFG